MKTRKQLIKERATLPYDAMVTDHDDFEKELPKDLCQHCRERKATINWVGKGGMMDYIHGGYERWCEFCVLKEQLKYALKHKDDWKKFKKQLKQYEG